MSQNNNVQPPQEEVRARRFGSRLRDFCVRLLMILFHNWPTKLLALVLAIALWAGLITQDPSLTRERHFTNVSISVIGEDALKRNGFIVVSDLDEVLGAVSVSVNVPQMQYSSVQASNYNVRVDLSRIKEAGNQQLRIMATNSNTYGTVTAVTPNTVELEVDEYITRYRIPVTVVTTGEAPEGFYVAEPSLDPPNIAVSGPRQLVERIARVETTVDLSKLPAREGMVRQAAPFTLLDENSQPIQSRLLEVTSESVLLDSIVVEQEIFSQRSITLADLGLVRGTPADGYEIKGVYVTPATVTVAGQKSMLDSIDLLYASSYIDVTDQKESVTQSMRIRQPAQLEAISTSEIVVTVEIGPVVRTDIFENIPVKVKNLPEGCAAHVDASATSATVHITGEHRWLSTLHSYSFTLYCDATNLTPGNYELPLLCSVRGSEGRSFTYEIDPATVQVTIIGPATEATPAVLPTT